MKNNWYKATFSVLGFIAGISLICLVLNLLPKVTLPWICGGMILLLVIFLVKCNMDIEDEHEARNKRERNSTSGWRQT